MTFARKPYPSDVSDEEWALVAPYLTLLPEEAGQREHSLREVFNGLRYIIKTGAPWRWMPNDLPPWAAVYQQAQRWLNAGCLEELAQDLRAVQKVVASGGSGPRRRRGLPASSPLPSLWRRCGRSSRSATASCSPACRA